MNQIDNDVISGDHNDNDDKKMTMLTGHGWNADLP